MIEFPYPASKANVIQGPNESPEEMQKKPKRPVVVQPGSRGTKQLLLRDRSSEVGSEDYFRLFDTLFTHIFTCAEAEEIRKAHEEAEAAMKSLEKEKEKEEIEAAKAQV